MTHFEFDPNRPIYLQICEEIKKRAVRGVYPAGDKLPSVREMAQEMGVNPNTMARAYSELERDGFLFTRRGQGSFVTEEPKGIDRERQALAKGALNRFVAEISDLGLDDVQKAHLQDEIKEALK